MYPRGRNRICGGMTDRSTRRWLPLLGLLFLAAASSSAHAAEAQTGGVTPIDFDEYPASGAGQPAATPITEQYTASGVEFVTPVTALRFDASSIPAGPLARSGSIAVTTCYGEEFCSNRVELKLIGPTRSVGLWVGSSDPLASAATVVVIGLDANGTTLSTTSTALGPSAAPIPVSRSLAVSDDTGRLATVVIEWQDGSHAGLLLDDVTVEPYVAPVRRLELTPATITLTADVLPVETEVTLTNTGELVAAPAAVTVTGSGVDVTWSVDAAPCIRNLKPDESCTIGLRLVAAPAGQVAGELVVADSRGGELVSAPVGADVRVATGSTDPSVTIDGAGSTVSTEAGGAGETPAGSDPTGSTGAARPEDTSDAGGGGSGETVPPPGGGSAGADGRGATGVVGVLAVAVLVGTALARRGTGERGSNPPASGVVRLRAGSDRVRVGPNTRSDMSVTVRLSPVPGQFLMIGDPAGPNGE